MKPSTLHRSKLPKACSAQERASRLETRLELLDGPTAVVNLELASQAAQEPNPNPTPSRDRCDSQGAQKLPRGVGVEPRAQGSVDLREKAPVLSIAFLLIQVIYLCCGRRSAARWPPGVHPPSAPL